MSSEKHGPRPSTVTPTSLYREMRRQGFATKDAVALAIELLGLIASELGRRDDGAE